MNLILYGLFTVLLRWWTKISIGTYQYYNSLTSSFQTGCMNSELLDGSGYIFETGSPIPSKQEIWTMNYWKRARKMKYWLWDNTVFTTEKSLFLLPTMARLSVGAKARASFCCCVRCSAPSTSVYTATDTIVSNDFVTQYWLFLRYNNYKLLCGRVIMNIM